MKQDVLVQDGMAEEEEVVDRSGVEVEVVVLIDVYNRWRVEEVVEEEVIVVVVVVDPRILRMKMRYP